MADILVQKDANNLVPKYGITAAQRAVWMQDFAIYDVNADGSKSGPYGPQRESTAGPAVDTADRAVLSLALGASQAEANAAIVQAALDKYTSVDLRGNGIFHLNPVFVPPGRKIRLDRGFQWFRANGVNAPGIKGRFTGQRNRADRFVRSGGRVTVSNRFHGRRVGDLVWVGELTDTTMHGIQTVETVTSPHAWTYLSAGSNGSGGATTVFGTVIPIRRVFAGSAFVSASNLVTVLDVGHDLKVGDKVWLNTTGASTAFCGIVEITDASADTWTYLTTASGTGVATGTIALSYDAELVITGDGEIEGNPLQNSTVEDADVQLSMVCFGMLNRWRIDVKSITGTIFRCLNIFNGTNGTLEGTEFGDTLVGTQFEGGAKNIEVLNVHGSTGKFVTGSRLADDGIAWTGTKTAGGIYDSTASPYGLDSFYGCKVSGLYMPNCLNGVKQGGDVTVVFDEITYEDINTGMTSNTITPLGNSTSAVRMVDDTNGLIGMTCGSIYIRRVRGSGAASAVVWSSKGTIKLLDIDGVSYAPNTLQSLANTGAPVNITSTGGTGGAIRRLRARGLNYVSPGASKPALVLGSGDVAATDPISIEELVLEDMDLTPNANASGATIIKYGNCTLGTVVLANSKFRGPAAGTGFAIALRGANNAGKWVLDNVSGVPGTQPLGVLFGVIPSDNTTANVDVTLRNCNIACTSLIFDNSQATSGTVTLRIHGGTVTPSNKLFNFGTSTANLVLLDGSGATLPAITAGLITKVGTLRVNGASIQIDGDQVTGALANDEFWNTNAAMTGSASIGRKIRTNAGTWQAVA